MKIKDFNLQSIRTKLIATLLLICLIPVAAMGVTSYYQSQSVLNKKLETTSKQTVVEINRGIDNYFSAMSNLIVLLSEDINLMEADASETYFEFGKKLMQNVKNTDDSILTVFIGTEKGKYYSYPETNTDANYDYKSRPWFKQAMEKRGQTVITEPYKSASTGKLVITIARTVEKNSNTTGVVGINIDLEKYSSGLSQIKIGDSGYVFISDANGILVSHPKKELIGTDTPAKLALWKDVSANKEGFTTYEYEGEKKFGAYYTSELTGMKTVASLNNTELLKDTSAIRNTMLIILTIVALIAILVSLLFSTPISKNIKKLMEALDKVAEGDLRVNIDIKSKDEFKYLGQTFNEMVRNISALIKNVNQSSTTVLQTSSNLASMAEETNASINEVAGAIENVAHGATEQAQSSQIGAVSIVELADNLNLVVKATQTMSELSKSTSELTNKGLGMVDTLIQKSNETKESATKVAYLVVEMSESTSQINAISDTISQITEQTNLLSLNASIEAARAGEAGRGFSVVAEEIRKLAEQSKESTIQIKDIIEDINIKSKTAVTAIKETGTTVKEQEEVVNKTQSLFNEIMGAVSSLIQKVVEIKEYTVLIDGKKENVVAQIENISSISEETASASEEVTASTEEITATMEGFTKYAGDLQKLSENLKSMIDTFKFN